LANDIMRCALLTDTPGVETASDVTTSSIEMVPEPSASSASNCASASAGAWRWTSRARGRAVVMMSCDEGRF
jgi:hypothetical protein